MFWKINPGETLDKQLTELEDIKDIQENKYNAICMEIKGEEITYANY